MKFGLAIQDWIIERSVRCLNSHLKSFCNLYFWPPQVFFLSFNLHQILYILSWVFVFKWVFVDLVYLQLFEKSEIKKIACELAEFYYWSTVIISNHFLIRCSTGSPLCIHLISLRLPSTLFIFTLIAFYISNLIYFIS